MEKKITTGDLIKYLEQFPKDTEIHLDKDGWLFDEIDETDPIKIIESRGLFWDSKHANIDPRFLTLNN